MSGPQDTGPGHPDRPSPPRSYYVRNPWRILGAGAFAGASTILTVTTLFYALGRVPPGLVALSVLLAAGSFLFGLYARYRAARFDAGIGGRDVH